MRVNEPHPLAVLRPDPWPTPSYDAVDGLVAGLVGCGVGVVGERRIRGRIAHRAGVAFRPGRPSERLLVPLMGERFYLLGNLPSGGDSLAWCWDVWEPSIAKWASELRRSRVATVFVSAEQSREMLASALPEASVRYMPEAIRVGDFPPAPADLALRSIQVLEMGRRHDTWHNRLGDLNGMGISHQYERRPGALVFASRSEMIRGLNDSVISVCFSRAKTHPSSAGRFDTMTQRYLESALSGCVILGSNPPEAVDFFGYPPAVEADMLEPREQVLEVLRNIDRYRPLVQRNYEVVRRKGSWSQRARELVALVSPSS